MKLAEAAGLNRTNLIKNYLPALDSVYVTTELPASSRNTIARVAKRPKRYIDRTPG